MANSITTPSCSHSNIAVREKDTLINMEYRLAKHEDANKIYEIVQDTIKRVYSKYYLSEIVDMFCQFHNKANIGEDMYMYCRIFKEKDLELISFL